MKKIKCCSCSTCFRVLGLFLFWMFYYFPPCPTVWIVIPSCAQLNAQIIFLLKYFRTQNIQIIFKITWRRESQFSRQGSLFFKIFHLIVANLQKFYLKLFRCERNRIYIDAQISVFSQLTWNFHHRDFMEDLSGI